MTDTDHIAIVTGASSGIGQAVAIELARRSERAILTYHGNAEGADRTVAEIEAAGGQAVALHLDVGDSATFSAFADRVAHELRTRWGRDTFDHLVNNAGFAQAGPYAETSEETFDALQRVILRGPYFLTQALLPLLADQGAIVNVTSSSALPHGTAAGYSAYATMKGGLAVLTRYQAKELAPRRIRVNGVAPGPTRTRLGGDAFERFPEVIPPLVERTALGRLGEGADVARAIAALLGDDGAWITGEHVEVSGGFDL
jgi:NAD(P)-dependent dehydrogenase (short-subunit alcohol dehydrogenase family)